MTKRLLCLLLVFAMVLGLASCGNKPDPRSYQFIPSNLSYISADDQNNGQSGQNRNTVNAADPHGSENTVNTVDPHGSENTVNTVDPQSEAEGDFEVHAPGEISLRYTDEERQNSPKHEAFVSPEKLAADCGDIKADFGAAWNLSTDDTLVVRDLPEKTDPATGYILRGYDVSLASGRDEFFTDVKLTIPRTAVEEEDGFVVTFNEETGKYERLYYEISEDGKSYIVYTDHFSDKFEVRYPKDVVERIRKIVNEGGSLDQKTKNYLGGIFYYPCNDRQLGDPMNVNVFADLYHLWSNREYTESLEKLAKLVERVPADQLGYNMPAPLLSTANDVEGVTLGIEGARDAYTELKTGKQDLLLPEAAGKTLGALNALVSLIYAEDKIIFEIENGKSELDAIKNNWVGVVGGGIALVSIGTFSAPVTFTLAVGGLLFYAGSKVYEKLQPRELYTEEQNYRDYYCTDNGFVRKFLYDSSLNEDSKDKGIDSIRRLKSLSDKESAQLSELINGKLKGLPGVSPRSEFFKKTVPDEWIYAIKQLYEFCAEDPKRLPEIMTEFYTNYARCFSYHDDFKGQLYVDYAKAAMENRGEDGSKAIVPSESVQDQYINNMVTEMMGWHTQLHKVLMEKYERQGMLEIALLIEQELVPLLNTRMVFMLQDTALQAGQTLTDSIYNKDPKLSGKKLYAHINIYAESQFDDMSDAEVPMRFLTGSKGNYSAVAEPAFRPKDWHGSGDVGFLLDARDYHFYPYSSNFLPKIRDDGSPTIFTCTLYNYLVMGAPTAIRFHDMSGKVEDKDVKIELTAPAADGVIYVPVSVDGKKSDERVFMAKVTEDRSFSYYMSGFKDGVSSEDTIRIKGNSITISLGALESVWTDTREGLSGQRVLVKGAYYDLDITGITIPVLSKKYHYSRPAMTLSGTISTQREGKDGSYSCAGTIDVFPAEFDAVTKISYDLDKSFNYTYGSPDRYDLYTRTVKLKPAEFELYFSKDGRGILRIECEGSAVLLSETCGRMELVTDSMKKYTRKEISKQQIEIIKAEKEKTSKTEEQSNIPWLLYMENLTLAK